MFDWDHIRAFLATVDKGSLTGAAQVLNATQPTVSRQVAALEAQLGVMLFERRGRGLVLTPSGVTLLEQARAMEQAAQQLSLAASGQAENVEGWVSISVTEVMAAYLMPQVLQQMHQQEPGIRVELVSTNELSDLKGREADIAIRGQRPQQSDLIARKLGNIEAQLYGSADYLASIGNPGEIAALSDAAFIGMEDHVKMLNILKSRGFAISEQNIVMRSNSRTVQWQMAKRGLGLCLMPVVVGDNEPGMVRVLEGAESFFGELWLVVHQELRTSRRVRRVFDFLADTLTNQPGMVCDPPLSEGPA